MPLFLFICDKLRIGYAVAANDDKVISVRKDNWILSFICR